jgi:hypothetical protein
LFQLICFRLGKISISFINQKNFPLGPLESIEAKYFTVGNDSLVDNLFLGNIGVLQGPGLIELILISWFPISLDKVFDNVLSAAFEELYEK